VRDFLDKKCKGMSYVDIARGSGLSLSLLYNLRCHDSDAHHMATVLRVVYGLSGLLNESAEDVFVEYMLGEVVGRYPKESCKDIRSWLDVYRGEMTYKDLSVRVGLDQSRISAWFYNGSRPSDVVVGWLIQAMDGDSEEMCRSFFRVAIL